MEFQALGKKQTEYKGLEVFPAPRGVSVVTAVSDEVTSLCPITGQPDQYTVHIDYRPNGVCIESKSLKLLFHSLRNKGVFCEQLASDLLQEIIKYANPWACEVRVIQKSRGGISLDVTASREDLE